ncbi:MAG TPA: FkbM family methyltransferase [Caulobacter sp.]|nr:FkbM family methyltransferase [Caulobacter sp.]
MSELIYDVGMHNGDDARYYLDKGFQVIGIEANPTFCRDCEQRFADEIKTGRMVVLNVGVGPEAGEFDFHINERESQISTFAPQPGNGDTWRVERVAMRTLSSIIAEFGQPYFVKIDVEHLDHLVLADLREAGIMPPYVSAEAHTIETFDALVAMGYEAFHVIKGEQVPERYGRCEITLRDGRRRPYGFPALSSGPFGDDITGAWLTPASARRRLDQIGLGWVDVHARGSAPNTV